MTQPFLTIIVPAYNEEARLPSSLRQIVDFLQAQPFKSQVIVVDDGSEDNTAAVVKHFSDQYPWVLLLSLPHRGKGHAVKHGMMAAQGDYLFICDADLSMPIEEVANFLPPVCDDYDVAIGSREAPGARRFHEPFYRHLMGRVFNLIVRVLAVRGFDDTQAGFKCFRREAAQAIFPYQTIDGWAFDVEVLHIAQKQGYHIIEVPIQWYYMERSQVKPVRDTINMFREVWHIRRRSLAGSYDARPDQSSPRSMASNSPLQPKTDH
ncbi:MAG: dolichyl-phosphate beta-glucosyltransferase [Anaerolineae bacterium]